MATDPAPRKVVIPYAPQPYQHEMHYHPARFKVACIGRRGGKTEFALNEGIRQAVKRPGRYWYVAPSYRQAKQIAWQRLKQLLRNDPLWVPNEQALSLTHPAMQTALELRGADNEDSLRGVGLGGAILDEVGMMKPNVWPEIIRPMLADAQGWALFIGTPKGKNHFHELFAEAADRPDWARWQYPTAVNRFIAPEEIAQMQAEMPQRLFEQEVLAQFLDDESGVFRKLLQARVGTLAAPVAGRFYVMGVDLGKTQDFTVLTVMDSLERGVVAQQRFQHLPWGEQKVRIQALAGRYNHALCYVDATGVGDPVVEDLQAGGVSCEPVRFTEPLKRQLVENLMLALEQRLVTYPAALDVLHQELGDFGYHLGERGRVTYGAPEGKHDDAVISFALAVWGLRPYLHEAQAFRSPPLDEAADRQGRGVPVLPEYEFADHAAGY